jgi:hypothetical protein
MREMFMAWLRGRNGSQDSLRAVHMLCSSAYVAGASASQARCVWTPKQRLRTQLAAVARLREWQGESVPTTFCPRLAETCKFVY